MARGSDSDLFSASIFSEHHKNPGNEFSISKASHQKKCVCGTGYFDATHAFAIQLLANTGQKVLNQAFFFD